MSIVTAKQLSSVPVVSSTSARPPPQFVSRADAPSSNLPFSTYIQNLPSPGLSNLTMSALTFSVLAPKCTMHGVVGSLRRQRLHQQSRLPSIYQLLMPSLTCWSSTTFSFSGGGRAGTDVTNKPPFISSILSPRNQRLLYPHI